MKPQNLKLKVKNIDWLNERVVKLIFTPFEPNEMDFIPGQHMNLMVDSENSRPYCFFTSAGSKDEVGLLVSAGHVGLGANYIKSLSVGDEVKAFGPVGRKVLNTNYNENIVFAATGTGIAPMLSMLDKMAVDNVESSIELYFGLKTEDGLFAEEELQKFEKSLKNFKYEIILSQPSSDWSGKTGYVTDFIEAKENTQYYIIGHREMVLEATGKLENDGVPRENIIS